MTIHRVREVMEQEGMAYTTLTAVGAGKSVYTNITPAASCEVDIFGVVTDWSASADVGNRTLALYIAQGSTTVWVSPLTGNIAASQRGGLDCSFGDVAADVTAPRLNLAGSALLSGAYLKTACPIATFVGTAAARISVTLADAAGISATDTAMYRILYRVRYP